jgi:NAD(P)-dependent dehydrogenase (short-subunit alcohol dehydrogenase family)
VTTFKDKAVLITGAGRGIGKRLALGFAEAGARVGLLARTKAELDMAHLEIEHAGGVALRIRANVCDYEEMCAAAERMRSHFGGVDVLVAAAAIQGPIGPLTENPPKAWAETVQTNLLGVVMSCQAVLAGMVDRRSGKILVLSGEGDMAPWPNFSAYAASKAAVVRFVETLAEEVRDHNIQVNCIAPGGTYSHMTDQILHAGEERAGWKAYRDALELRISGGVPPEKQLQLALFLASERSNHISGKLIHVADDWKRLESSNINSEIYTLRRVQRVS